MNSLKLSEAIREGAKIRPYHIGYGSFAPALNGRIASSVLGAAEEGALGEIAIITQNSLSELFPVLLKEINFTCESHNDKFIQVWGTIDHLSGVHKWTREQIADWLAEQGY